MIVGRLDKRTAKALMRALYIVVSHVLADELSQVRLTERDAMTACWCRLIHPASISITSCLGEHHDFDFMGAILLRTTAGNTVAERPQSAEIR